MPDLADGERVTVQGSGANSYVLARERQVYSCTCPAWRNMRLPILQRRCKHLVAYLNDTTLASVSAATRVSNAVVLPVTPPRPAPRTIPLPTETQYDEQPELRQQRDAALNEAVDLHVVLFDKMEETYGLRLPKDIAYAAGFYLALRDDEKAELARISTRGLAGIGLWFAPGGLDYMGDARLRDRLPDDPPEVINVMYGAEDKPDARLGLVYDEPFELPVGVVHREPGNTTIRRTTLLESIRDDLKRDFPPPDDIVRNRRLTIFAWLNEVIRRAQPELEESSLTFQSIGWTRGSFPVPYVPGWSVTEDLVGIREHNDRQRAYSSAAPVVNEWIDRALKDLADGSPGRALFLGREMHMSSTSTASAFRAQASELLIRAYAMLGRGPLLEITRAHHLELYPDVDLYEPPPPHAIVIATDPEEVARAWDLQAPTESEIEEAFKRASSVEVFDAIFERVDEETRDRVTRTALGRRLSQMLRLPAQSPERKRLGDLVGRFLDRTSVDARAFERIVQANDNELSLRAARSVDLTSNSQGATPLHIAARFARPALVKTLLDRGADARAKNAKGRWPFDDASAASYSSERDAHEVMLLLEAAGGGVGKVPSLVFSDAPPSWKVGDKVHHAKFGEGVVTEVGGTGDDAKLQIRFGPVPKGRGKKPDVKTLLGKFVERR